MPQSRSRSARLRQRCGMAAPTECLKAGVIRELKGVALDLFRRNCALGKLSKRARSEAVFKSVAATPRHFPGAGFHISADLRQPDRNIRSWLQVGHSTDHHGALSDQRSPQRPHRGGRGVDGVIDTGSHRRPFGYQMKAHTGAGPLLYVILRAQGPRSWVACSEPAPGKRNQHTSASSGRCIVRQLRATAVDLARSTPACLDRKIRKSSTRQGGGRRCPRLRLPLPNQSLGGRVLRCANFDRTTAATLQNGDRR